VAISIAVAAGCTLWLGMGAFGISHLLQLRSLARAVPEEPSRWPRVSVIVAARDEATDCEAALRSRLADDYPDLEVVFVDDRSTDGTGEIAARVAAEDPRVRVVRVETLPAGWLGKVNALAHGVAVADGEWFLFSDADVYVASGGLRRAIAHAEADGLDMLALVPEYASKDLLVNVVWTVFLRVMMLVLSPRAIRDPRRKTSLGSGAFNLVRRSAFERTPGFEWLRLETADDMALAMMVKGAGGRLETMDGRGIARVEIYRSAAEFFRGIEKNGGTTAAHPWRFTFGMAVLLAVEYSPFLALAIGPAWMRALGAVALVVATVTDVLALRINTGRIAPALMWPLGTLLFVAGTLRATWLVHRRGGVLWRGTFYPLAEIHSQRRFRF